MFTFWHFFFFRKVKWPENESISILTSGFTIRIETHHQAKFRNISLFFSFFSFDRFLWKVQSTFGSLPTSDWLGCKVDLMRKRRTSTIHAEWKWCKFPPFSVNERKIMTNEYKNEATFFLSLYHPSYLEYDAITHFTCKKLIWRNSVNFSIFIEKLFVGCRTHLGIRLCNFNTRVHPMNKMEANGNFIWLNRLFFSSGFPNFCNRKEKQVKYTLNLN